jgi:hypothetical protein
LKKQEQLSSIMSNQEITDKRKAVLDLYKHVKLTERERKFLSAY